MPCRDIEPTAYLLPRRCGGMLVLQSHRARSISSHLPCRAAKAESDKSSIWKGNGTGLGQGFSYVKHTATCSSSSVSYMNLSKCSCLEGGRCLSERASTLLNSVCIAKEGIKN